MKLSYALHALIFSYSKRSGDVPTFTTPVFSQLYECFDTFKNPLRETLLVAIGSMGKTAHSSILGQVLCILTAQLGRQNPVIRGMASVRVSSNH